MRKYCYLAYDLACICGALVVALYLRHGFPLIQEGKPQDLYILLLVTLATAAAVLVLMNTHTSMWRFTSSSELAAIMIAVGLVVLITNSGLFLISRLEMVPRSVPPMHWALAVTAMGGSRLLVRKLFGPARQLSKHHATLKQHVLVMGACHTAELYLQFIKRIVQHAVVVEGFVDSDRTLTNRIFQKHKILGTPEDLPRIIEDFLVHGIHIKQVVLAHVLDQLTRDEKRLLLEMEGKGVVELVHFGQHMGPQAQPQAREDASDFYQNVVAMADTHEKSTGYYPYLKRVFDIVVASVLMLMLLPLMVLTCLVVAMDVGLPVIFWQQRPGMHGTPFNLYKFRTMRQAGRRYNEDRRVHKSGDIARTSLVGRILRRLRWDELPQLFHIIAGKMSFVGPRPLLPEDQPAGGEMRLSVRPGVTGWAQIHGGDALTPPEKLILDVWYIRHMSLWLDLRIMLRTLFVVVKEDKPRVPTPDESTRKDILAHE